MRVSSRILQVKEKNFEEGLDKFQFQEISETIEKILGFILHNSKTSFRVGQEMISNTTFSFIIF